MVYFKWLGSYRHGIIHLGGRDAADLRERTEQASRMLGWRAPYVDSPQRTRGNEPLRGTAPPKSSVPCSSTSQPESIT